MAGDLKSRVPVFKTSLLLVLLLAAGGTAQAFPSEAKVLARLRPGLSAEEVVARLGEPSNGRVTPCVDCSFTYLPSLGSLTVEKRGYTGLRVWFAGGKVSSWEMLTGNPSYAEPKMPPGVRQFIWFFLIMFALGTISKFAIGRTPIATLASAEIGQAFAKRELQTERIPAEFRFITHETTLQEVIARLGEPSRIVEVPIDSQRGLGYALTSTKSGDAKITVYEYDLAYHAAVIVIPEFPFEMENRIRALFYRPIQRELAQATD